MSKKLLPPLAIAALFVLPSFQPPTTNVAPDVPSLFEEVVYAVQLRKQVPVEEQQNHWELDRIEAGANDSLFAALFQKVRNKEIDVCFPVFPFTEKMDRDSAVRTISIPEEVLFEDPVTFDVSNITVVNNKLPEDVIAVVFHEEWVVDAATLTLEKKVKGIIPIIDYGFYYDGSSYVERLAPCFYIPFRPGTGEKTDFNVSSVEYDFEPDSVRLWDYPAQERYVTRSSYSGPAGKVISDNLLMSFKSQPKVTGTKLFSATYPHTAITDKKAKAASLKAMDSTEFVRFRESWTADLNNMTFTKKVKGVYFGNEFVKTEIKETYSIASPQKLFSVYLPLNGSVVPGVPSGKVSVENYSCNTSFHPEKFRDAEHIQTKDSAGLTWTLKSMVSRGRAGTMPVYSVVNQWEFNDPLDKRRVAMTPAEIYDVLVDSDLVMVEENGDFREYYVAKEIGDEQLSGFEFIESWTYDPAKNAFTKKVKTVGVLAYTWADYEETKRTHYLFSYDIRNSPGDSIFSKSYLVAPDVTSSCVINWCEYHPTENENSTPVTEYYPTFDQSISNEQRFLLVQQIINQVLAGKLVAWSTDSISKPMTVPQFSAMLDTVAARNGFHPEKGKEYYMFNELSFSENWYYNPQTGEFGKQVKAITFGHRSYMYEYVPSAEVTPGYFTIKVNGTK